MNGYTITFMDGHQQLIKNLERLMNESGLTSQVKLARAAGISQTNLSAIMRGAVYPQLSTLIALSKTLKVEVWQLIAPQEAWGLLSLFARLNPEDQVTLLRIAHSLLPDDQ